MAYTPADKFLAGECCKLWWLAAGHVNGNKCTAATCAFDTLRVFLSIMMLAMRGACAWGHTGPGICVICGRGVLIVLIFRSVECPSKSTAPLLGQRVCTVCCLCARWRCLDAWGPVWFRVATSTWCICPVASSPARICPCLFSAEDVTAAFLVWVPLQFINFRFVPIRFRVTFVVSQWVGLMNRSTAYLVSIHHAVQIYVRYALHICTCMHIHICIHKQLTNTYMHTCNAGIRWPVLDRGLQYVQRWWQSQRTRGIRVFGGSEGTCACVTDSFILLIFSNNINEFVMDHYT